jgi:hypothetical protein
MFSAMKFKSFKIVKMFDDKIFYYYYFYGKREGSGSASVLQDTGGPKNIRIIWIRNNAFYVRK